MIGGPGAMRLSVGTITRQQIQPGTIRRIIPFAKRYRSALIFLLLITAIDAAITAVTPGAAWHDYR